MDRRTLLSLFCLIAVCSGTPLAWERLPVGGAGALLQSRWFAGSVVYNGGVLVYGGQGRRSILSNNGTGTETLGEPSQLRERIFCFEA